MTMPSMSADEAAIRALVAAWMDATRRGDAAAVRDLMTEDVVFLRAGHPPMIGRDAFAAAMRPPPGAPAPVVEGSSEIREVQIAGDLAYLWSELRVRVTPPGGTPVVRAGPALTILRKEDGRWQLARDANLVAPVPPGTR
jgi:uncharacterized protein (TIGR02246 family)